MLKVKIDSYKFYEQTTTENKDCMICSIKSSLVDSVTGGVIAKFNNSTRIVKNEFDEYDELFARNYSFSCTKIKVYRSARNYMIQNLDPMHLDTIIGIEYMNRFESQEINHCNYLCGNTEDEEPIEDLTLSVMFSVLGRLPLLRGSSEDTRTIICDSLCKVYDDCNLADEEY